MPRSESPSDDNSCDQVPVSNFTMSSPRSPQIAGFATLLPEYSGASDQGRPFFEAVESVARLANWDDDTTLIVVRSKFVGEAAHFLRESIDLRTGTNLQTFKAAVLARFQPSFPLTLRLQKFMSCKQKIDEGVLPYAARFKNLAYDTIEPDASEAVRQAHEKQMVAQFLSGLTFSGKRFVMSKNPTKLEETIKIAVDEECNSQLMGQDKGKNVCSAVTADETNDLAELKALFVQVLTKLDRNAPQPSSQFERPLPRNLPTSPASSRPVSPAPMRRRCFQCGNDRHLIANCPDLRSNVTLMGVTGKVLDTVGCFKLPIQINDQCFTFPMYVTNESFTSRYDGIIGIDFCKRFGVTYDAQNRRVIIKDRGIEVEESINSISTIDNNKKCMSVFSDEMIEVGPREERVITGRIKGFFQPDIDLPFDTILSPQTINYNVDDYKYELTQRLKIAFEFVQVNLEKAAEGQEKQVAKKATLTEFRLGDKVLLFSPAVKKGTTHKLNRPYKGPYRILERLSQINYKIGHIFNKRDIKIVHVDRIKEFIERTPFPAADLEAVISENDVPKKVLVPESEKEISNHPTGQKKKPIDPWLLDEEHPVLTTPVLNNARINQPNEISLASPANSRNFVRTPQRKMPEQRYALRSTGTVPKLPWIFESTSTKEVTGTTENPASAVVTAPEPHVDVSAGNASVDVPMSEVDTCSKEETELRENDTEMDLASSILAKMDYWLS
ncbi:Retrovirus-related Pol polyprotein [Nymphon striatum]|nr:Retrovirus-related Pol polyprotein [Nymphon striatum]